MRVLDTAARILVDSSSGSGSTSRSATRTFRDRRVEMKAEELLWDRSTNRDFRYTAMLSDGDAMTFNHLSSLPVYDDMKLQKEECINHVAKRLGTAQVGRVREEGWRHPRRSWQW